MVNLSIQSLGRFFQDYRQAILGDSFSFGPVIDASKVKYFALHHSVTPQTAKIDGNWKAECDRIASTHVNNNGWAGVGYRFIICSDGTVAYVGDLSHGGAAVREHNDEIFSACFVGDFTKELPTAAQVHSAHLLVKHFLTEMPQYPMLDSWDDLIGHQDAKAIYSDPTLGTACPGSNWRAGGDSLRDRVIQDRWNGYPSPEPTSTTPTPQPAPEPTPEPTPQPEPVTSCEVELQNRIEQVGRLKEELLRGDQLRESLINQSNVETKRLEDTLIIYEESLKAKQTLLDEQGSRIGALNTEVASLRVALEKAKEALVSSLSLYDLLVVIAHRILSLPASSVKKLRKM